jgi:hypothetical protein
VEGGGRLKRAAMVSGRLLEDKAGMVSLGGVVRLSPASTPEGSRDRCWPYALHCGSQLHAGEEDRKENWLVDG